MKTKFKGLLTLDVAAKAVAENGDALRYVLNFELFKKIAAQLNIEVEI